MTVAVTDALRQTAGGACVARPGWAASARNTFGQTAVIHIAMDSLLLRRLLVLESISKRALSALAISNPQGIRLPSEGESSRLN